MLSKDFDLRCLCELFNGCRNLREVTRAKLLQGGHLIHIEQHSTKPWPGHLQMALTAANGPLQVFGKYEQSPLPQRSQRADLTA